MNACDQVLGNFSVRKLIESIIDRHLRGDLDFSKSSIDSNSHWCGSTLHTFPEGLVGWALDAGEQPQGGEGRVA